VECELLTARSRSFLPVTLREDVSHLVLLTQVRNCGRRVGADPARRIRVIRAGGGIPKRKIAAERGAFLFHELIEYLDPDFVQGRLALDAEGDDRVV